MHQPFCHPIAVSVSGMTASLAPVQLHADAASAVTGQPPILDGAVRKLLLPR